MSDPRQMYMAYDTDSAGNPTKPIFLAESVERLFKDVDYATWDLRRKTKDEAAAAFQQIFITKWHIEDYSESKEVPIGLIKFKTQ